MPLTGRSPKRPLVGFDAPGQTAMSYDYSSIENRLRAKRLLDTIRKEIAAEPPSDDDGIHPTSQHGAAAAPSMTISNAEGIHIYKTAAGYYADVCLKETPPGIPRIMGTPLNLPHQTFELARQDAVRLVRLLIANGAGHQCGIRLPQPHLPHSHRTDENPGTGARQGTTRFQSRRIRQMAARRTRPRSCNAKTKEAFDQLSTKELSGYLAVFAIALLGGIIRWPIPTPPHASGVA